MAAVQLCGWVAWPADDETWRVLEQLAAVCTQEICIAELATRPAGNDLGRSGNPNTLEPEREPNHQQKTFLLPAAGHKGYCVPEHVEAIRRHGPCPVHRRTFAPIKTWFPQEQQDEGETKAKKGARTSKRGKAAAE